LKRGAIARDTDERMRFYRTRAGTAEICLTRAYSRHARAALEMSTALLRAAGGQGFLTSLIGDVRTWGHFANAFYWVLTGFAM